MPLPTPNSGEGHDAFIDRCMSDTVVQEDFDDEETMLAVCESQWEQENAMSQEREERRYFTVPDLEVRAADEDGEFVARGHAATFMEPYQVADFQEQIHPDAFNGQLTNEDVAALWNHDDSNVLGSVGADTLDLSTDDRGLVAEIDFPESANREREAIERGDVRKMSFGFRVPEGGDRWERMEDGTELRTIMEVDPLFDVSPVTFPANPNTGVEVAQRSRERWKEEEDEDECGCGSAHAARKRKLDLAEAEA